MESPNKSLSDILEIIRRRKWSLILPAIVVFAIAGAVAFLLPPVFRSSSTILIEDQEIPRDYVVTTVTSFAEQRLQTINQRIMGATRLLEIIKENGLYSEYREKWTNEEVIDRMRKDISFETISADVIDPKTGRPTAATIAFRLAYKGENPSVVQKVTGILTSFYLEENLKVRGQQTEGASRFLEDEMKGVKANLEELEARIASFKEQNLQHLPELSQFNLQALDRTERDIDQLNSQLRALLEKESYLAAQLAAIPTESDNADRTRLNELRVQLTNLRSRVSENYPDVIKMKAEIADLEGRLGASGGGEAGNDNPTYITLASQLAGTRSDIAAVRRQIDGFYGKRDDFRRRIEASPRVEEGYKTLLAERNNVQVKYDDLTRKYMEAKVAQGLEKGQMGERFTLIEPAMLPEKPVSPNRPAILLIGLILGIGAGVGLVALKEYGDRSVRCADVLTKALRLPVLAAIPEIVTRQDILSARRRRRLMNVGVVTVLIAGVLIFHFAVMDLDIFWAKVARRLQKM